MLKLPRLSAALLLAIAPASPAAALCIYKGVDNATTTLSQEFRDSRWVVRARVLSGFDGAVEADSPDAGMRFTVYRLAVVRAYKGRPAPRLTFFTERNSGGFYMDRPWRRLPGGHDVGGQYLLFLNPIPPFPGRPAAARSPVFVNYSCGQSRLWREVRPPARRRLAEPGRGH